MIVTAAYPLGVSGPPQVRRPDPTSESDYTDTGCPSGGPSCLACILPRCVLDAPQRDAAATAYIERVATIRQHAATGMTAAEIATAMTISRRAVWRALQTTRA